jgi:hypothetical protein
LLSEKKAFSEAEKNAEINNNKRSIKEPVKTKAVM